ncbi:MAG: PAS domain S-box protein [Caldilineaceae bacterium]|nr:PAS domain S-box protein [Caldilineaceae bacterium]
MNTILLLLDGKRNQKLLAEWLQSQYHVIEAQSDLDLNGNFSLAIVDGPVLDRLSTQIQARKTVTRSEVLPFLLVTNRQDVNLLTRHLWLTVDDLVISPINKLELQARVEVLLRTRRLALELKQLQEAMLEKTQTRLHMAVQAANIGLWDWNLATNQVYFSPEWKAQIGYQDHELSSGFSEWESRVHPDDLERFQQSVHDYLANPWPDYQLEFRFRHKNGAYRWILMHASLLSDEAGRPTHLLGSHLDMTDRKVAEEQLYLQSAALHAAANGIVITDIEGAIQWCNPAFTALTGYTVEEAIGKNPRELVKSGKHDRAFFENMWGTLLAGNVWQGEIINRKKDGSLYTEVQTITPVRDNLGRITHFIAIKQDITQRKALETENQKLAEQFSQAQKMDSIGNLAGGIAHDLNNLLVPVVGYSELGMLLSPPGSKLYGYLEHIYDAGNRAAALTRQILAFSRQQMLEMKTLDLNQVVLQFEKMLRRLIGEHIAFETHLDPNLAPVHADAGQLEQVLLNLVVNARDAMPDGGSITIETSNTFDDKAVDQQPGMQSIPHVLLAVSDTGSGMDAAVQQRIFEPFFTTKARGQGTGLGLSTVFGIVKQHQGNIRVYSEPNRGTTFRVYLPVAPSSSVTAEAQPSKIEMITGTETILIVEDEVRVRQLVCDTLRAHGYHVLEAEDPAHCLPLATFHPGRIHLLLTDVVLPTMSGRELYQQMAAERPDLRVLYMSGYTNDMIGHRGVLDEGTIFLQKPFTINTLLNKVRMALQH